MLNQIIPNILSSALIISAGVLPGSFPVQTQPVSFPKPLELMRVVKPNETLQSIAAIQYGDAKYWTTLWNDNAWITNPNEIEPNWSLKVRAKNPSNIEPISHSLVAKYGDIIYRYSASANSAPHPLMTGNVSVTVPVVQSAVVRNLEQIPTSSPSVLTEAQINYLGNCESGMTATRNSGNGYYGAFQYSIATWNSMGTGYARADLAPLEIQKAAVQRLLSRSSIYTQFPGCAKKMRAAGLL